MFVDYIQYILCGQTKPHEVLIVTSPGDGNLGNFYFIYFSVFPTFFMQTMHCFENQNKNQNAIYFKSKASTWMQLIMIFLNYVRKKTSKRGRIMDGSTFLDSLEGQGDDQCV